MKLEDLEAKLGIANMGEEDKLALVKDIQANLPALKAEQRSLEAKTQANLVVEAIKKIKEGLEARFDELNGIVDVKVRDITSGKDGIDGKDGKNGVDGRDGKDGLSITGPKGADGEAGQDGVGVQDAHIDFDGSLIITLTDGRELNVGEVVPMDVAEKIKIIGNGGGTSQSVLDAIAALQAVDATYGTMATQNANSVAITGGSINGTTVGATTAAAGTFTTLIGGNDVANYGQLTGGATTKAVEFKSLGSDTNVAYAIRSKGTGAIDLAAGSSGVNISNGGTVTAITLTANGTNYTTPPAVAITAPTTAGGVQATATCVLLTTAAVTVNAGGTGYTVNDVLTLSGGTFTVAATYTVTAVSGGVVTAVSAGSRGSYTATPTTPAATTGGTGTGCTLTPIWGVSNTFTITNAGSGYVEQPTVTFSGGGGSGAAAYATVGSGTTVKSIGATLDVSVDNTSSPAFRFYNSGGTGVNYWSAGAGSSSPFLFARGSTNTQGNIASNGSSSLAFFTNGGATQQFAVTHTASAVNYVQVTGSATGAGASALGGISFTGSDASPNFAIGTKGTGYIAFYGQGATNVQAFRVSNTNASSSGNLIQVQGAAAGSAPSISAISGTSGSDTNIDLTLTPKGTGIVKTSGTGIQLVGSTSGYVGLKGAAAAGSTTYTLPAADGTNGQVLATNGSATLSWATASGGGALAKQTDVFTTGTAATYTAPANTQWVKITVVGIGGSGGFSTGFRGQGGSAGGVAIKWLAMTAGQTLTYTVSGSVGTASTVSSGTLTISTITANSGTSGGTSAYAASSTATVAGGTATGGDINITGGEGGRAYGTSTAVSTQVCGKGGDCPGWGTGGVGAAITAGAGGSAQGYGAGAGGCLNTNGVGTVGSSVIIFEAY